MLCMPSQHHAIGLQPDRMVVVPAPCVRLPDSHVCALCPQAMGSHPWDTDDHTSTKETCSLAWSHRQSDADVCAVKDGCAIWGAARGVSSMARKLEHRMCPSLVRRAAGVYGLDMLAQEHGSAAYGVPRDGVSRRHQNAHDVVWDDCSCPPCMNKHACCSLVRWD